MSRIIVLSDRPLEKHEQFLAEAMESLDGSPVFGVALVALMEDGTAFTGYHGVMAGLAGKQLAAAQIQADVTDAIVRANIADYLEEAEECEEEEADEDQT